MKDDGSDTRLSHGSIITQIGRRGSIESRRDSQVVVRRKATPHELVGAAERAIARGAICGV